MTFTVTLFYFFSKKGEKNTHALLIKKFISTFFLCSFLCETVENNWYTAHCREWYRDKHQQFNLFLPTCVSSSSLSEIICRIVVVPLFRSNVGLCFFSSKIDFSFPLPARVLTLAIVSVVGLRFSLAQCWLMVHGSTVGLAVRLFLWERCWSNQFKVQKRLNYLPLGNKVGR